MTASHKWIVWIARKRVGIETNRCRRLLMKFRRPTNRWREALPCRPGPCRPGPYRPGPYRPGPWRPGGRRPAPAVDGLGAGDGLGGAGRPAPAGDGRGAAGGAGHRPSMTVEEAAAAGAAAVEAVAGSS